MTPDDLLTKYNINLASIAPGRYYTTCPQCSAKRSKAHQRNKVLGVTIDAKGAHWGCNHCGWTGPEKDASNGANGGNGRDRNITYDYQDASGTVTFQKIRAYDKNGEKKFWLQRPDGNGGWNKGVAGVDTKIIYRLPEIIELIANGQVIATVEGEKDADKLWRAGIPATCNAHGATDVTKNPKARPKWTKHHSEQLAGADIVVFNDNDAPGYAHAEATAKLSLGIAKRVRRLDLAEHWPNMPHGADVSDWLAAGHSAQELATLIEQAPECVDKTKTAPAVSAAPSADVTEDGYMKKSTDIACNVGNVLLALDQEPEIMNAFGFDEMLNRVVLLRPLFHDDPNFKQRPVTDADVLAVQKHLQWRGFRRLGKNTTHDGVNKHALDHAFHPIRNHLDRLRWDGKGRLQTWLADCFGAEHNEYTEQIGTMFPIAMVARIYKPGCKVDYMPTVEGEQGILKSTAFRILAGDEYFSDQLPDVTTKECFQHLRGKWLIEVAELNAYSRADVDRFKAFLVRQVEQYRPPWGHNEVHEPRQCCFVGTTNKNLYLKDETGNRRFWPIRTGEIDLDWLHANRDQLFAEAVNLYRGGVHWWPDRKFERQHIQPEQEARFEVDAWEGLIKDYLDCLHEPKQTTLINIAVNALGYELEPPLTPTSKDEPHPVRGTPINRLGTTDQRRITAILKHLDWEPNHDEKRRWWEPKKAKKIKGRLTA